MIFRYKEKTTPNQQTNNKMTCGNYVCGSNENLKLCFQCDTLFCPDCGPPDVEFDDNIDPEEIYCGGCVPNECDKCGDKSYEYSTELCPQLGDGYYCYECIEEEEEEILLKGIKCNLCKNELPPHTKKQHLNREDPIHNCPHR